jgi:hypothetical protein
VLVAATVETGVCRRRGLGGVGSRSCDLGITQDLGFDILGPHAVTSVLIVEGSGHVKQHLDSRERVVMEDGRGVLSLRGLNARSGKFRGTSERHVAELLIEGGNARALEDSDNGIHISFRK